MDPFEQQPPATLASQPSVLPQPQEHKLCEGEAGKPSKGTCTGGNPDLNQPGEWEKKFKRRRGFGGNAGGPKYRNINTENPQFFNELKDERKILREQPHHRRMLELAITGFKIKEIAALTGFARDTVRCVLVQPWAKDFMADRLKKDAQEDIQSLLKDQVLPSLELVIDVRDNDQLRAETRLSAAQSILDRVLGKAAQPILSGKIEPAKLTDAELEVIAANGRNTTPTSSTGTPQSQSN